MPSRKRPQECFEPLPPDLDIHSLVNETENFEYVDRIPRDFVEQHGVEKFKKLVLLHVILGGKPLVIDGFHEKLDPSIFNSGWLKANYGLKIENAWNITQNENLPLTIGHYLNHMGKLTEQFFQNPKNYKDAKRQRIYLKDIDCPPAWQDHLREQIPSGLFYWNESTGNVGGAGSGDEFVRPAFVQHKDKGRGIGPAGDLMSSLPLEMRAQNLMCYVGHEGTYTPSHHEMCASLGQNIMVEASGSVSQDGTPERPGSSLWFMTESKDRHLVSEYWSSVLGHDIKVEKHFAQLDSWKKAPFKTYIVEQKPGDFILIPPLAPHQVWNRGRRTMKVAWNRTTVETLELAMREALPNARLVCRDEQYKNKSIVYFTLQKYSSLLRSAAAQMKRDIFTEEDIRQSPKIRQVKKDFKRLFELYKTILISEMFAVDSPNVRPIYIPYDSNVTCAYCRGNIFNRFLTCRSCISDLGDDVDEPYDICMDCFVMGRSCRCVSNLSWCEQWRWHDLLEKYEEWRNEIIDIDGGVFESSPGSLLDEQKLSTMKSLAQICQEQLKIRPCTYKSVRTPAKRKRSEEEIWVGKDGFEKKVPKKCSKSFLKDNKSCHVCLKYHEAWKMVGCTSCVRWFCYDSLVRGYDLMPKTVMEDPNWKCPHCRLVCSSTTCYKDRKQTPYQPIGTIIGYDTRKYADIRSVESLVDFSKSNLPWTRKADGFQKTNTRLWRHQEEAKRAKQEVPVLDERYVDDKINADPRGYSYIDSNQMDYSEAKTSIDAIDPRLSGDEPKIEENDSSYPDFELGTDAYNHLVPIAESAVAHIQAWGLAQSSKQV